MSLAFDVANLVLGIIGLAGFFDLVFLYVKSRLPTSRLALLDDHLAYTGHMFRSAAESHLITEETALGFDKRLLKARHRAETLRGRTHRAKSLKLQLCGWYGGLSKEIDEVSSEVFSIRGAISVSRSHGRERLQREGRQALPVWHLIFSPIARYIQAHRGPLLPPPIPVSFNDATVSQMLQASQAARGSSENNSYMPLPGRALAPTPRVEMITVTGAETPNAAGLITRGQTVHRPSPSVPFGTAPSSISPATRAAAERDAPLLVSMAQLASDLSHLKASTSTLHGIENRTLSPPASGTPSDFPHRTLAGSPSFPPSDDSYEESGSQTI